MMTVQVDDKTGHTLQFAAKIANMSVGEVVARLVRDSALPTSPPSAATGRLAIHADYEGFRSNAYFEPTTERVEFVEGPLAGKSFKSPSGAARAVISHYKPEVDPNRNGWGFWIVSETGEWLQSVRR
jgi:hypothetical protein